MLLAEKEMYEFGSFSLGLAGRDESNWAGLADCKWDMFAPTKRASSELK